MAFDDTGEGGASAFAEVPFGTRLKLHRTRRGLTREVLGGLVGRSASWVKALETGRLGTPRLPLLLRLAQALRVRDLAELTGAGSIPVEPFSGPGHRRLPAVRAAVNAFAPPADRPAPPLPLLHSRLRGAWLARHAAPDHREVLGALLPGLITDAQAAVLGAAKECERRTARALLSEVYSLAQFFLAYQPAQNLLWRVCESAVVTAREADDPRSLGIAAWLMVQAHRDAGDWDAADAVTAGALEHLGAHLADADSDELLSLWGALQFEAGHTAARRGESGAAWHRWDTALRAVARLPDGFYHPVTSFSRAVMGAHAVTVAVELRNGGEGVRQALRAQAHTIPSRPRRARHRIEQARAHRLDGREGEALELLAQAHAAAPETIRYNGHARAMIAEGLSSREYRAQAAALADRVGVPA
ncbi:Transcriptional regulator, contains XRE-family HTH domain [Nocardiopsis flavescens]|uniref:Transcriptional regulator, contains XRE-family HTH domain n=1 Tax=Nocardiopsis flavescens TaxID=758803 RepID=A0A1M6HNH0_9ACTN|nr:helix-turn-helix transcriptional regulator [Nocardiopsis flavescens]SHJ23710.1 Transcriptional regulator, contains XRE-family HTH domain [Nocardiopsis flavescens]